MLKLKVIARLLILAGLVMIGYYYGTSLYTYAMQKNLRQQWRLASKQSRSRQNTAAPANTSLNNQNIFGRIRIPKLGLDVIVLEGTDQLTLTKGPGHMKGTAWPWQRGNTVISGHRTTFGAPFAGLNKLKKGDLILLSTTKGLFSYRVTGSKVVKPNDMSVVGQKYAGRLTLTTCDPPGSAVRRLTVWAQKE